MRPSSTYALTRRSALFMAGSALLPLTGVAGDSPAELPVELAGLELLGSARMRFFGLNMYDAKLWAPSGFKAGAYAQNPFALELIYLRSLDGKAIAERSLKEMQRQGTISNDQEKSWLAAMLQAFPDVKTDDRIVGAHTPGVGARFWHNGQPRPGVRDAEFSRMFFGIWLSDATSEPQMRSRLLGLKTT